MHILIIPGVTMPKVEDSVMARIRQNAGPDATITLVKNTHEAEAYMGDVEVILGVITPEMFKKAKRDDVTYAHLKNTPQQYRGRILTVTGKLTLIRKEKAPRILRAEDGGDGEGGRRSVVVYPGDYKTTFVGDAPVIMVRTMDGAVNALVNRCSHKGSLICYKPRGNIRELTCVYHNWTFNLEGKLTGVAFRKGVGGKGGVGPDFDSNEHNLVRLRVEERDGFVYCLGKEDD